MSRARKGYAIAIPSCLVLALALLVASVAHGVTLDITNQFTVSRSGFVLNRSTNTFDATVRLSNATAAPVLGPIAVAVGGLPAGVTLANSAGQTADGRPYVSPLAPGTQLAVGATQPLVLKFANPSLAPITYSLQVLYTVEEPLGAPSLLGVFATSATASYLIGRVDGAPSQTITLEAKFSATCVAGTLVGVASAAGPISATTDRDGYFGTTVQGLASGTFVTVALKSPRMSPASLCQVSSRDNDAWPKAFPLQGNAVTVRDYIDVPGRARWYKVAIAPGQRLQVTLSGLPDDYDVAVFKDIAQTFARQFTPGSGTTHELVRLAAETAPSTFSPSTFSPSTFSPSTFSPDAYAPSTFSPSTFSPSVYAPSTFSPSTFSPSTFSPSTFSPSTFSPSTFSPSTFSPSTFSPSIYSEVAIAQAFSTAQTRSIVAYSPVPGTASESLVANTWNNTGDFYVRVTGRAGAFSTTGQFTLSVEKGTTSCAAVTDIVLAARPKVAASGRRTVMLVDSSRVPLDDPLPIPGGGTLREKLDAFVVRSEVLGILVDVAGDARVRQLKQQADANPACPFARNLVAEEIKGIVDSYRANPLRYVVLLGNDESIPFFRSPDVAEIGQESSYVPPVQSNSGSEASLRRDFVLSQDGYGSSTKLYLPWSDFPVPGLAVGRLIETGAEIATVIDAYFVANGVVLPRSSLVTGYDFLEDAAGAVKTELGLGTGQTPQALITPKGKAPADPASWTSTQLRDALLGARHDVVFLAGHFSANSALAADFATSLLTTELAASTVDFTNTLVFSAGCHSGYNLVDAHAIPGVTLPLDWAQAFARKGATLVAGTGYQYGDTDFLEYSERLYRNFARNLRAGTGGVAIGEALVRAKVDYLATTAPDILGLHEKALLQATLFGLPMMAVDMPAGRGTPPSAGPVIAATPVTTGPAGTLGLRFHDLSVASGMTPQTTSLKNLAGGADVVASWLNGPDGVVTQPGEPALPLVAVNVTPTDSSLVLRGVGFRGGVFVDTPGVLPFTGAPTTEVRGVHAQFVAPVFYPARMWSPNYFGALAGAGGTQLLVTPAQHRIANLVAGTSTQRRFNNLDLRLYYSGQLGKAALADAPSIVEVKAVREGTEAVFTASVVGDPSAAIHQVWITYASNAGTSWSSIDLVQCVAPLPALCSGEDSRLWKGRLAAAPAAFRYIVQAASGIGLVAVDDNRGAYYALGSPTPAATTAALVSPPSSATVGETVAVKVRLAAAGTGIAGKNVAVAVGDTTKYATTGADGVATVGLPLAAVPGTYLITASFSGDEAFVASSTSAAFALNKAPSALAAMSPAGAVLTGTLAGKTLALQQEAVQFTLNGPQGQVTVWSTTDHLGRAQLPPPGLPGGSYSVAAVTFPGNATHAPASLALAGSQLFSVPRVAQTLAFPALPGTTIASPLTEVSAMASSGLAVAYTVSGGCALQGTMVIPTGVGTCTVTATQSGDALYAPVSVQRTFTVGRPVQTLAFGPAPSGVVVGQPLVTVMATSASAGAPPSTQPILFSTATPTICTVGTSVNIAAVTLLSAGTCSIAANQAGDAVYDPAPQATQSFTVAAAGAAPATFTVTNTNDSGAGSLRSAIAQANATPGPNIVNFSLTLPATIVLNGQIGILGPTRIVGPGAGQLTIDANFVNRHFFIGNFPACPARDGPDYLVEISGLRLVNGRRNVADSSGGAISSQKSLSLDSVVIENSAARAGGGLSFGIDSAGQTLRIVNSTFLGNFATELVPSTTDFDASGGAVYVIERCASALDTPYTEPVSVSVVDTEFLSNSAQPLTTRDGRGGAFRSWSRADVRIDNSVFTDNFVLAPNPPVPGFVYRGGAIEGFAKSIHVERTEISGNAAVEVTETDATRGGGLHIYNTASDRQGPNDRSVVRIVNSTISGNTVTSTAGAMSISGNISVSLVNSTVADNVAPQTRTGGITAGRGQTYPVSGILTTRPSLTLVSSLLGYNSSDGGDIAASSQTLPNFTVSATNSLVQKVCASATCAVSIFGAGNLLGIDPLLGPLADNGGPSKTHALLPGSPAINAGSNPFGLTTDQRGAGFPRLFGPAPDIGAFEVTP